jgi:PTH2 family peptidyl-tRNA hydrolase
MNNPDNVKMVIVIRKDLKMRRGKETSQGSHSAVKVFFDRIMNRDTMAKDGFIQIAITPDMIPWIEGAFTKVVVGVDSEDAIYALAEKAKAANIPCAVIVDNGFTEFHGHHTTTCIALGPAKSEILDPITGELQLI